MEENKYVKVKEAYEKYVKESLKAFYDLTD